MATNRRQRSESHHRKTEIMIDPSLATTLSWLWCCTDEKMPTDRLRLVAIKRCSCCSRPTFLCFCLKPRLMRLAAPLTRQVSQERIVGLERNSTDTCAAPRDALSNIKTRATFASRTKRPRGLKDDASTVPLKEKEGSMKLAYSYDLAWERMGKASLKRIPQEIVRQARVSWRCASEHGDTGECSITSD